MRVIYVVAVITAVILRISDSALPATKSPTAMIENENTIVTLVDGGLQHRRIVKQASHGDEINEEKNLSLKWLKSKLWKMLDKEVYIHKNWKAARKSQNDWRRSNKAYATVGKHTQSTFCIATDKLPFVLREMTRQVRPTRQKKQRGVSRKVASTTSDLEARLEEIVLPNSDESSGTEEVNEDVPSTQLGVTQLQLRTRQKRGSKTVKIYRGFRYTKSWHSAKNIAYRCSTYRTTGCSAVLKITPSAEWTVNGEHTCRHRVVVNGALTDETIAMKRMTDRLASENPEMPENDIWELVCAKFYGSDREELLEGLTQEQVVGRVRRVRRRYYGGNIHGVVEVPPCSKVKDSTIPFFRFHLVTSNSDPKKPPNRVLGWAHPALKDLLLYRSVSLFIDGTFRCVPRGFYQCVIVMVDDPARNMFTPVYFVLCTSKTETMYEDVLQLINRDTDKKMTPAEVVCDFEFSLISSVQQQFPNAEVVGCFFHFKQALLRRMKHEHITEPEMKIAMEPGVLDVLTVIDPDLIDPKGIAWVKLEIKKRCAAKYCVYSNHEWRTFWSYFRRIWLERYFVTEWNVFGIANSVVARTNNPLERFNREMNAVFKPHPNLRQFVATIAKMSTGYARRQANITKGLRKKKTRAPRIDLPPAPDLTDFVVPPASDDEDVQEDSHSSSESLCSDVQDGLNGDLSSDDEIPNNGESAEDLEQEITENADTYDFSVDWDGDSESDGRSETDY